MENGNPFPYSDSNKRYHTYTYYLRGRYGGRVAHVPLSGGFTCPNRDGTKGEGGCAFCSSAGSGEFAGAPDEPIPVQFERARAYLEAKWGKTMYIAYFQAFSGTYAPVERLRTLYTQALAQPDVVGLSIATRPDCVGPAVRALLAELARGCDVTVELGVQTARDQTRAAMGCGYTWSDFVEAFYALDRIGVRVCAHVINGLPGETERDMLETAAALARIGVHAVKLHALYAVRGTRLGGWYEAGALRMLTRAEYVEIVCRQLELLPAQTVVERLTGDGERAALLAPDWSRDKRRVLGSIDQALARGGTWQGARRHTP